MAMSRVIYHCIIILPYYHVTTTESHAYPHSILLQVGAHQLILDQ